MFYCNSQHLEDKEERTFRVAVEDNFVTTRMLTAGVYQEICFSAKLCTVYINDIPAGEGNTLALFADDAAFVLR